MANELKYTLDFSFLDDLPSNTNKDIIINHQTYPELFCSFDLYSIDGNKIGTQRFIHHGLFINNGKDTKN